MIPEISGELLRRGVSCGRPSGGPIRGKRFIISKRLILDSGNARVAFSMRSFAPGGVTGTTRVALKWASYYKRCFLPPYSSVRLFHFSEDGDRLGFFLICP
jgi:hypothetical protein